MLLHPKRNTKQPRSEKVKVKRGLSADSVHKVFSSTFEPIPNRRGEHPFRIARMSAIEVTKGPAAILYGPRTTGRAINMFSTPVPDDQQGYGQVMFGTNDRQRAHLWLGGKADAAAG